MPSTYPIFRTTTAAAVLAAVALLSACSGGGDASDDGSAASGTIDALLTTDPSTFDPATAAGGDDYTVDRLLYDTLLRRDDDAALVGGLATDWEAIDASTYAFTIRDDATCSDGTEITPSVVAASLEYFAAEETGSSFAPLVFGADGDPTFTADDAAGTLTIALASPYANVERGLTLAQSGIICAAGLADLDGLAAGTVDGAFSGPYTLAEAQPGIGYSFALREDYDAWPQFAAPLEGTAAGTISYTLTTDQSTSANQLLSGDIDVAGLTGDAVDRFEGQDDYAEVQTVAASVYVLFNEREGSYFADNPEARQAVARAIDQQAYNTILSDGRSELFTSVVSPSYACVLDDTSLLESYDPDAAAEVLTGAPLRIVASTAFGDNGAGAEYVQQVLTTAGASVDLTNTDNATWATTINTPSAGWDLTIMGDINAVQVISASLDRVMGTSLEEGGRSIGAADNAEGAAALAEGLATSDTDAQCAAFRTAQESMLERDDVVPLAGVILTTVTGPDVSIRAFGDYVDPSTLRLVG